MNENDSIFGCFVSGQPMYPDSNQEVIDAANEKSRLFRDLIWGANGLDDKIKPLPHQSYGHDLILILFRFYLNPIPDQLLYLKDIDRFRKNEKSIAINIIVTDDNFFNRMASERQDFMKGKIMEKVNLLAGVITRNRLDTKLTSLMSDLEKVINS